MLKTSPPIKGKMPSPFLQGGGGLSPTIFEECSLICFSRKGEAEKEHKHTTNKFDTEIDDILKGFC